MNNKKKFVNIFGVLVSAFIVMGICINNHDSVSVLIDENIEALTNPDEPEWVGKKLKKVDCTCPNGNSGFTMKCKKDGDLEDCTATQQGSNACYKVNLSGVKKLCDF